MTPISENRWEFPKIRLDEAAACNAVLLDEAAKGAGLRGEVDTAEPLGSYIASRGNETRSMHGYLMRVRQAVEPWPKQDSHRRLWCLAEEARVRIRRKPLRRFIDLALRSVSDDSSSLAADNGRRRKPK